MSELNDLQVGSTAPDFTLPSSTGDPIILSSFQGQQNVVIFFMREFIWMQCIAFAVQLGQSYSKLQAKDTAVLVIGGGGVGRAQVLAKNSRLPFPVLADADRSVYEQYKLGTKLLMMQQSGLVVIDKAGAIRFYQRYTNPGGWMRNSEITAVMQVIDQLEAAV